MNQTLECTEFLGLRLDPENRVIHVDLTKPQLIHIIGVNAELKTKEYILKVTGRGLMLV